MYFVKVKSKKNALNFLWAILTGMAIVVILFPVVVLVATSIKSPVDATTYPPKFIFKPNLDSYRRIFTRYPFFLYARNSLVVTLINILVTVPLGIMGAYSFSRFQFRGKKIFSSLVLLARMLPAITVAIPFSSF